ncbi:Arsenate reductase [Methylophaga frappieri]|uniref:Arsenate reductase n=1 Tax=Methylophaga frappieri (strain ATCC BAA-2434 / DSM 25690 / JAM7) TaxID=754477 RepID=I1YFU3_METFJ|nr:arsenate reductase (glutaredoxin) [Methylophaga frappieri]AFJ01786.1 Arsenate reductase [Methylophaga frappieri]
MSQTRIYHNPRCSKSRETLALLEQQGEDPEIILYLKSPPTPAELAELLQLLGIPAEALLRKGEADYKSLGIADKKLTETQLIELMSTHPKLIERPIVVKNGKAKLGRPPEQVKAIL